MPLSPAILKMLDRYQCETETDYTNALKEIIQEVALTGLWRSGFFEKAAFYGGTALRIFHGLDRFSEDLDFSLLEPDADFAIETMERAIQNELEALGFTVDIERKIKREEANIRSSFIKANTIQHLIAIGIPEAVQKQCHLHSKLKVKFEIDIDPPGGFQTESLIHLQPTPFSARVYAPSDLFAGKLHALLCRTWKKRVKGRDWYDFVWYVGQRIPLRLHHLKQRMIQTSHIDPEVPFNIDQFQGLLAEKIESLSIEAAKSDVLPFVKDPRSLDLWSKTFFLEVARRIEFV